MITTRFKDLGLAFYQGQPAGKGVMTLHICSEIFSDLQVMISIITKVKITLENIKNFMCISQGSELAHVAA